VLRGKTRSCTHNWQLTAVHVIALFGPTAVGKTNVALALAGRLRALGEQPVAISADALQVYEGLAILTGAASPQEQAALEHRLVGFVPITETFSAGEYAKAAHQEIDAALAGNRRPIVVGGTGLYLRAALAELDLRPPVVPRRDPPQELHAELARRAPEQAAAIAPTDTKRLARLLALLDAGHPLPPPPGTPSDLWTTDTRRPTVLVGLVMDREALAERIARRVDLMVQAGAVEEVRRAHEAGASSTARAALGFDALLRGDVEAMKTATRRYARRQITWMRKLPGVQLIDVTDRTPQDVAAEVHAMIPR
jgi:tRNA dimethylallyltransferase